MMTKISILFSLIFVSFIGFAQKSTPIAVRNYIRMPKDTVESKLLVDNLNSLLEAAQGKNEMNHWILPSQKMETYILMDEINGIEKSRGLKDNHFFKPYLTNIVALPQNQYLIQFSYIGVFDSLPHLKASFEVIAHKNKDRFLFSSPLVRNTTSWKSKQYGAFIFHFSDSLNEANVLEFTEKAALFDRKLNNTNTGITEIYCCENRTALLKLIGVNYKMKVNGLVGGVYSSGADGKGLQVSGEGASFGHVDVHDLWHDRLSMVKSRRKVNKPVDEGIAYLYGGSWGMTWEEILSRFKKEVASNPATDWREIKENPLNFGVSRAKHLMADYVINALLVQKIEKEHGFAGVWKLLDCGVKEKGNENYYRVLEQLTGISKENYNEKIGELISQN